MMGMREATRHILVSAERNEQEVRVISPKSRLVVAGRGAWDGGCSGLGFLTATEVVHANI